MWLLTFSMLSTVWVLFLFFWTTLEAEWIQLTVTAVCTLTVIYCKWWQCPDLWNESQSVAPLVCDSTMKMCILVIRALILRPDSAGWCVENGRMLTPSGLCNATSTLVQRRCWINVTVTYIVCSSWWLITCLKARCMHNEFVIKLS